jgi:hypothetical protein
LQSGVYEFSFEALASVVTICKKTKSSKVRNHFRGVLFHLVGKITVGKIKTFFYWLRMHRGVYHIESDLISEALIVLELCIGKCDIERADRFAFYYTSSLHRRFQRIFENNYIRHAALSSRVDMEEVDVEGYGNHIDLTDEELSLLGFNRREIDLVKSKLKDQKIKDFIREQGEGYNQHTYYKILASVKKKAQPLRK